MNNENLTSYKPGQSGNPKGKPKGAVSIVTILKKLMNKKIKMPGTHPLTGEKNANIKIKDAVALRLVTSALAGNTRSLQEIIDRLDGKVTQPLEHSIDAGNAEVIIKIGKDELKD